MERRRFVAIAGGVGAGLLIPAAVYRYLMRGINVGDAEVRKYLNDGPDAALHAITPVEDFYVTSSHGEPAVDGTTWSLTIDGLVAQPQRFSYDEIRKLEPFETTLTLECISNPVGGRYIGNARWKGTRLKPLLDRARILPEAKYAVLYAAEGYTTGHPVARMLDPANCLAYDMNGTPLTRVHGFPLRILMPGRYGMKLPKWLTRIEFVSKDYLGFWEWQGWSNVGGRQLQSVIDDPHDRGRLSGESFVVTGYAISDVSGVSKVEISTDSGATWHEVDIFSNPMPSQVWAFWKFVWIHPPKGKHTLKVRATDGRGRLQTSHESGEWPDGATGYHTIDVEVTT
jgi:DMSO/TMAO reductase YedYZ molybdopterin-dependent catalytic subunit